MFGLHDYIGQPIQGNETENYYLNFTAELSRVKWDLKEYKWKPAKHE